MSKLHKLLDEKWPLKGLDKQDTYVTNSYREAFTEGYNAAKEEATKTVTHMGKGAYPGRKGCKCGDTNYDSVSVAYGYKIALQDAEATLRTV